MYCDTAAANSGAAFCRLLDRDLAFLVNVCSSFSALADNSSNALLPQNKRAGILTISGKTLTEAHLSAAGVPLDTPIGSTEDGREFTRVILDNEAELDVELARQDNVDAALALQNGNDDLGAIVLECTNMCPYAADISEATGLPVFSIVTFIKWFQASLTPRRWPLDRQI